MFNHKNNNRPENLYPGWKLSKWLGVGGEQMEIELHPENLIVKSDPSNIVEWWSMDVRNYNDLCR